MGRKVLKFGMRRGWLGFEGIGLLRRDGLSEVEGIITPISACH